MSGPLYQRFFARLLALGDGEQEALYGARKDALFAGLEGAVLEIGPGTGVNFAHYPPGLRWIGAEPNPHMHPYLRKKAAACGVEIDLRAASIEKLDLEDESVDAVVSTLVLCSVADVEKALAEIRRLLRPGGRFLFIEHVAAPRGTPRRCAQRLVKPLWRPLADGCRPDRETGRLIRAAGFAEVEMERFRPDGLAFTPITPHIIGTALR